jgi:hypothetical protein
MEIPLKRMGVAVDLEVFRDIETGRPFLVFKTPGDEPSYHCFGELEAKAVAKACGAPEDLRDNTNALWDALWNDRKAQFPSRMR